MLAWKPITSSQSKHLWLWGVEGLGTGPCGGPSLLGYPGSLGGLPASRLSMPVLSIRCMYTFPTTIVCSSATLPLLLPLSTLLTFTVFFPFPVALVVFLLFVWSYTGGSGMVAPVCGMRGAPAHLPFALSATAATMGLVCVQRAWELSPG